MSKKYKFDGLTLTPPMAKDFKILCIDEDEASLDGYEDHLDDFYTIKTTNNPAKGLVQVDEDSLDSVIYGINNQNKSAAFKNIKEIKKKDDSIHVITVIDDKDAELALEAVLIGCAGHIRKSYKREELYAIIERLRRDKKVIDRHDAIVKEIQENNFKNYMIGSAPSFVSVMRDAEKVRGFGASILIDGETGTGKELLARYVHAIEGDPKRPFIAINCAAIPDNLIESELFGHEKGTFTDATRRKIGKFELADGGDIFLDEITSLRPSMQSKLLRVLQDKMVYRLGNHSPIYSNFRTIAATNENLEEMVNKGAFRIDLYHRLAVVRLTLPPLRDRCQDISELVDHFINKYQKNVCAKEISDDAMRILFDYSWPGNIRELENLIHSLIITSKEKIVWPCDLPAWLSEDLNGEPFTDSSDGANSFKDIMTYSDFRKIVKRHERNFIGLLLGKHDGDCAKVAEDLGIARSTLYIKLKELGLK